MGLAPEPGIGRRLAAAAEAAEPPEDAQRLTGVSTDGGVTFVALDLDSVMDDEAIALEDAFDMTWLEFMNRLQSGSVKAHKALVWLAQRRDNPNLTPADVSYEVTKFQVRAEPVVPLGSDAANDSDTSESSLTPSVSGLGNGAG